MPRCVIIYKWRILENQDFHTKCNVDSNVTVNHVTYLYKINKTTNFTIISGIIATDYNIISIVILWYKIKYVTETKCFIPSNSSAARVKI